MKWDFKQYSVDVALPSLSAPKLGGPLEKALEAPYQGEWNGKSLLYTHNSSPTEHDSICEAGHPASKYTR